MDKIISINDWVPHDAKLELAKAAKEARLKRGWKRDTLSEKTGIPLSTLKRYELTGDISLNQFLMLTLDDILKQKPTVKRRRGNL